MTGSSDQSSHGPDSTAGERPATYTYDPEYRLYYFAPADRADPPYLKQIEVRAIIDIAADGTLAGVELIDRMPPAPAVASPDLGPVSNADETK